MSLTDIVKNIQLAFLPASIDDYLGKRAYVSMGLFPGTGDYLRIWSAKQEDNEKRVVKVRGDGEIEFNTTYRGGKRVSQEDYAPAAEVVEAKKAAYVEIERLCGGRCREFKGIYYFSFQDSVINPVNKELVFWSLHDYWNNGMGRHTAVVISSDGTAIVHSRAAPDSLSDHNQAAPHTKYDPREQLAGNYKMLYDTACILLKPEQSDDLSPMGSIRQFYNGLQRVGKQMFSSERTARTNILAAQ